MEVSRLFFPAHALPGLPLCVQNVTAPRPLDATQPLARPLYAALSSCGFPSPADDHVAAALDLNELVLRNPPATFFVRASGDSMTPLVDDGDLCVVDRSLAARSGDLVVACVDGAFTLKRLRTHGPLVELVPENPAYPTIRLHDEMTLDVFGVVTFTLKAHGRGR